MSIPFIYGRPVKGNEFLGRVFELSTIFQRLENGESTAIVGEPHIGKTSLLFCVANPGVQLEFLGETNYLYSYIDLLPVASSYTQKEFWEYALSSIGENLKDEDIVKQYMAVIQDGYSYRSLEKMFRSMDRKGQRLILLLDEFDRLLCHRNFRDPAFFASLRALSTHVGGISFVIASRATLAELEELGRGILDAGSPFFNNFIQVSLRPFGDDEINNLLDRAGEKFTAVERKYIRRVAGKHPFLLQALSGTAYQLRNEHPTRIAEVFYDQISHHFDDLWYVLDDNSRTVAVILSLVELGGRALGNEFSFGEIENVEAFGPQLRKLEARGMAERVGEGWQFDFETFLLWRGERWTCGSQAFTWWVRDVIIAGSRTIPTYNDWLRNKRYTIFLTQEMWDKLNKTVRNIPGWATKGIGYMARSLFDQLIQNDKASN